MLHETSEIYEKTQPKIANFLAFAVSKVVTVLPFSVHSGFQAFLTYCPGFGSGSGPYLSNEWFLWKWLPFCPSPAGVLSLVVPNRYISHLYISISNMMPIMIDNGLWGHEEARNSLKSPLKVLKRESPKSLNLESPGFGPKPGPKSPWASPARNNHSRLS